MRQQPTAHVRQRAVPKAACHVVTAVHVHLLPVLQHTTAQHHLLCQGLLLLKSCRNCLAVQFRASMWSMLMQDTHPMAQTSTSLP